jgi:sensor histidine kinase YesM
MIDYHLTWRHAFIEEAPPWIFWSLAIPFIYIFVRALAQPHWAWPYRLAAHAGFLMLAIVLDNTFRAVWYDHGLLEAFGMWASTSLFTYGAILGGVLAYYYSQRYVDREVELAGARLHALQAQLRPHFMFNALNSVAMLVRGGRGPEAVEMIARVSDVLRDSLDEESRAEVTLAEEVALARRYLAIEEVRFADRLDVRVDLTEQAKTARVPRLILQPVVENAVRHGIGARAAAGRVEIAGRTTDDELVVTVRDDGPGPRPHPLTPSPAGTGGAQNGNGVGLKNTRERLRTAYGETARFTLEHGVDGGAVATIVIPLQ